MTAFDSYFAALVNEDLPVSVPIVRDTAEGIATVVFDAKQNPGVYAGVTSDDWRERATTAVYAIHAAREAIDASANTDAHTV